MPVSSTVENRSGLYMTFNEIYEQNADMVLNLAFRMSGREDIARDLTQDVFIKVYQKIDTFQEQSKISTWIYRIAMNHILNYLKREKRISFFDFMEKDATKALQEGPVLTYWEQNLPIQPDDSLQDHEKELIVRHALDSLAPKYRIPFMLFRYEEMSYLEIAEHLEISLSAVETRIHRAKNKLADKLKPWLKHL